jgi:hypothetical protein
MGWRVLADFVVLVHFGFVVFVVAGGPLVRWRPAVAWAHLPALAWAAGILAVGYTCPLTVLEAYFRRRAGQQPYPGGFVDHYIENVLYPERLTAVLLALAAAVILWGYAPLIARRRTPRR